jgi:putative component of membrane protein insertase Oxa1/YidC/SpoIIIJ protein YidD
MVFSIAYIYLLLASIGYQEPWGCDAELVAKRKKQDFYAEKTLAAQTAKSIIAFHQKFLSPTTGPRSSFRPSSSKYMELAIQRYGFLQGFCMGCDRLLRENSDPWVYRTVQIDGITYKYDPAFNDKYFLENP